MKPKVLESILGVVFLSILAGSLSIMIQFAIPKEQERNELRVSRSAYLAYQAQYLRAEE